MNEINVSDLASFDTQNSVLLDVRSVEEFRDFHVKGALNIPIESIKDQINTLEKDKKYIVYCSKGIRARKVTQFLENHNFDSYLLGGILFFPKDFIENGLK